MMPTMDRVVLHISDGLREVVDPQEVFYLEATDDETRVRRHGRKALLDVRSLGDLLPAFAPHGFVLIHRSYAVNLRRIRQIRKREDSRDWEVRLAPPVNRLLPVSRNAIPRLLATLES